jgi:urease accessory protein
MMRKIPLFLIPLLAATPALAHPGHGSTASFAAGVLHPLTGVDHILAMVAVGMLAFLLKGRALWQVPAAFVGMMAVGGAMGLAGLPLPMVEAGIGLSIIVIGGMVAFGRQTPATVAVATAGVFAIFHGHAHGAEMASGLSGLEYAAGFVLATAALHGAGIAAGFGLARLGNAFGAATMRIGGAIVAVAGIGVLAGVF